MTNNKLSKFCIFCGKKPKSKTREHVIPQWLIKYTGDPNREISLGVDTRLLREKDEFKLKKFSFKSFQFPACDSCNEEFSSLEAKVKEIIEKIILNEYLSNIEINTLLDWFDKVRIGLWLGSLLLDRDIAPVDPKFFIKNRMAEKDRGLFVYKMDDKFEGIQFIGFNSPAFQVAPSCFALCINNFYFFNFSTDYLFAKNIGFPYPSKQKYLKQDERIIFELEVGLERIKLPLIRMPFLKPSIEVYQPIFPTKLGTINDDAENTYGGKYVKENCIDFSNGLGNIFYKDNGKLNVLDNETELCLNDDSLVYKRDMLSTTLANQVLKTQLKLLMNLPSVEDLDQESRIRVQKIHKSFIQLQKSFMKLI